MTEDQVREILREVYSYLKRKGMISDSEWVDEVEPRIEAAAKRIADQCSGDPAG